MGCGQVIKEMTDGGADYCFECIGLASVMNDAFNSSREVMQNTHTHIVLFLVLKFINLQLWDQGWGKTVILGVEMHGSPISLNSIEILKGRSVCGTFFGGLKPKSDIATLAQKYLDKVHLHSPFIFVILILIRLAFWYSCETWWYSNLWLI